MNNIIRLFLVSSACLLSLIFTGCAAMQHETDLENQNSSMAVATMKAHLAKVQIGMTQEQVVNYLGDPSKSNVSRNAAGESEQWIYTAETLINNAGYDYWHLNQSVIWGYKNIEVYLYFDNGILTSTQGF